LQIHLFVAHFPLQEHKFSFSVGACVKGKAGLLNRLRMAATTTSFDGFGLPFKYFSTKEQGSGGNIFFACFLAFLRVLCLHLNFITSSRITLTYPKKQIAWNHSDKLNGNFKVVPIRNIYLSLKHAWA
jgi:hypothetical protein